MSDLLPRQIDGVTALVTGANRGLGKAFTQALLNRGAAKVYAGARDPGAVEVIDARIVPVRLDITNPGDVPAAARDCTDVSLVINNAGAMLQTPFLSAPDTSAARVEMETNTSAHWRWRGRSRRCWPRPAAAPWSTCCRW